MTSMRWVWESPPPRLASARGGRFPGLPPLDARSIARVKHSRPGVFSRWRARVTGGYRRPPCAAALTPAQPRKQIPACFDAVDLAPASRLILAASARHGAVAPRGRRRTGRGIEPRQRVKRQGLAGPVRASPVAPLQAGRGATRRSTPPHSKAGRPPVQRAGLAILVGHYPFPDLDPGKAPKTPARFASRGALARSHPIQCVKRSETARRSHPLPVADTTPARPALRPSCPQRLHRTWRWPTPPRHSRHWKSLRGVSAALSLKAQLSPRYISSNSGGGRRRRALVPPLPLPPATRG